MMRNITKMNPDVSRRRRVTALLRRKAIRSDRGQSLVELALIVPIFFLMLLGAVEFARLAYDGIEVSNAARAGVAYGAQSSATASDAAGIQLAATSDGADISGLSATSTQFCSCSNAASTQVACSTAAATCSPSGSRVLNYVQVNTTATVDPLIHYPGLPTNFTLTGLAIMRVQQ